MNTTEVVERQLYQPLQHTVAEFTDKDGLRFVKTVDRGWRVIDSEDRAVYEAAGWTVAGIFSGDAATHPMLYVAPPKVLAS